MLGASSTINQEFTNFAISDLSFSAKNASPAKLIQGNVGEGDSYIHCYFTVKGGIKIPKLITVSFRGPLTWK